MITQALLAAALTTVLATAGCPPPEAGGGWTAPKQAAPKPKGCPPSVMWMQPNVGTVTQTRTCTGFLGTTVHYAHIDGDIADGWVVDYQQLCQRGDDWVGGSGCE